MTRVAKKSKLSTKIRRLRASKWKKGWNRVPEDQRLRVLDELRLIAAKRYFGSLSPEDLLNEALTKAFAGDRSWRADLDLRDNLYRVLTSLASNELQKSRRFLALDETAIEIQGLAAKGPKPLQMLEADEQQRLSYRKIHEVTASDPFLTRVVDQLLDLGEWKPTRMALALDVSPKEIYTRKRRLQRKFAFLLPVKK